MGLPLKVRRDAKSISLLAIFTAMIVALEALPIVGITDIKIPGLNFTIDWTGIPIAIVFMAFGFVYSIISITVMWISIAYRNFPGAAFKGFAETFRILGIATGWLLLRNRNVSYVQRLGIYTIFSSICSGVGMYVANIVLLPFFYGLPLEVAIATSGLYIPWNIVQAIVNMVGAGILYRLIPEDLRASAGFREFETIETQSLTSNHINSESK